MLGTAAYIINSLAGTGTSGRTADPPIQRDPQAAVSALVGANDQLTTDQTVEARPVKASTAVMDFTDNRGERGNPVVLPIQEGVYSITKPAIVGLTRISQG